MRFLPALTSCQPLAQYMSASKKPILKVLWGGKKSRETLIWHRQAVFTFHLLILHISAYSALLNIDLNRKSPTYECAWF